MLYKSLELKNICFKSLKSLPKERYSYENGGRLRKTMALQGEETGNPTLSNIAQHLLTATYRQVSRFTAGRRLHKYSIVALCPECRIALTVAHPLTGSVGHLIKMVLLMILLRKATILSALPVWSRLFLSTNVTDHWWGSGWTE
ncbi:hypothetical protein TNCV_2453681 [Trichonephila clavipes]|nr:hypothetical protein TNCV_2453681 [Trichonephila clavipes]